MFRSIFVATILTIFSGCATCPEPIQEPAIGKPPRAILIGLTQEQWDSMRPDVQDIYSHDTLAFQKMIRRLEARIDAHDKALEVAD